jgi:signal transduction histidine kinase
MNKDCELKEPQAIGTSCEAGRMRLEAGIACVVHELRNPLSAIRAGLKVLETATDHDRLAQARELIARQVAYLSRLVDDLVDLSRLSQGKVALVKTRVCLKQIVDQALETAGGSIQNGGHTVKLALPDPPMEVFCDAQRLVQVFSNLIENAAKYTPKGGAIAVSGSMSSDTAEISVVDNGVGIPQERLEEIFLQFAQLPESSDGIAGLGLGLYIVRLIVHEHGGTVTAKSNGRGNGSEFVVRIPREE